MKLSPQNRLGVLASQLFELAREADKLSAEISRELSPEAPRRTVVRRRRWTNDEQATLERLVRSGETAEAIGEALGRTPAAIDRRVSKTALDLYDDWKEATS